MLRVIFYSIVLFIFTGCLKSKDTGCHYNACGFVAPANEIQDVQNYLTANNINAIQHCSGAFYVIESMGNGKKPDACSEINVNYVGKLTNGTVFDQGTFRDPINLQNLVKGWTNTIPLISQGGKIHLYIPPSLGYGNSSVPGIPPNSILIFDVELTYVN